MLLLGCESTGAIFTAFALLLKTLGKAARMPSTHDSTVYGSTGRPCRTPSLLRPPRSRHLVCTDALTVLTAASSMSFKLSMGMSALA